MTEAPGAVTPPVIESVVGVMHARGSLVGGVTYWVGTRLGRPHCALRDMTHGFAIERSSWRATRAKLPVPFDVVHLDERDLPLRDFTEDNTPTIVARTDRGLRTLLGPIEIEGVGGHADELVEALVAAASSLGLVWANPRA